MADIKEAFGELGGAIKTALGLTKHNRLREQIKDTIDIYKLIPAEEKKLQEARDNLAKGVTQQSTKLLEVANSTGRTWNWSEAVFCWILVGLGGFYFLFYFKHSGEVWWETLLLVTIGLISALMLMVSFQALFKEKSETA